MMHYSKKESLEQRFKEPLNFKKLLKQHAIKQHSIKQHSLKQQGVVLFFALIALVVMSLAAVALIRSVDTNSLIAGNLSFKQSTMFSADRGVEDAIAWLTGKTVATLNVSNVAGGYHATSVTNARTLIDASGIDSTLDDGQGNAIRFVIQRMCQAEGGLTNTLVQKTENCLFAPGEKPDCRNGGELCVGFIAKPTQRLLYHITARVTGPKNTVSYIQTFAF